MKRLILILFLISTSYVFANERQEIINQVRNDFIAARNEALEAREYCLTIHATITLNTFRNIELCASEEKFRIYKKYALTYPAVFNILLKETDDLLKMGRAFTEEAILGRGSADKRQKDYYDNVQLVINRTSNLLLVEAKRMGEEAAKEIVGGSSNNKGKPKIDTIKSGSAFFVNNKGNIITNNHVVEKCNGPVGIIYQAKEYPAKVISTDKRLDLAVLNSNVKPGQYLKLSKRSGDKLDRVVAAGYPLGDKISGQLKLTAGIISATIGWNNNVNEFQIDAALNPGNSGGPIVNDAGNLLGVAVAGLKDRQNLNFAIKSKAVKDFLDVNKISYSTAAMDFDMDNKKRLKLLEESTVFIFCN